MGNTRTLNIALWTIQILLALFFAGASGAPKFFLPDELLAMPIVLPRAFLVFIGTAEVLGALGLILPGVTRVRSGLTPLAAACLVVLTICAAVYQVLGHQPANAVFALIIGLVAAFVAYGRWRLAPLGSSADRHEAHIPAASVSV
jgi:hypothetical protein